MRAERIQYMVNASDSILDLSNGFSIYKDEKWRGQHVEIAIQVPVGKKIRFDETVSGKLNPAEFKKRRRERLNNVDMIYYDRGYFWWRSNTDYIMQADGRLLDTSRNKVINNGYRYESEWKDPSDMNMRDSGVKSVPSQPLEINQKTSPGVAESMDDDEDGDDSWTAAPFPAFSLVRTFF